MSDDNLTPREVEVLRQIAGGNRNRDIGETLRISEETVKVHVKHIMDKLGAKDRTQAISIAVRRGNYSALTRLFPESGSQTSQNLGIRAAAGFSKVGSDALRECGAHLGETYWDVCFSHSRLGWPGFALLLLRGVSGLAAMAEGVCYMSGPDFTPAAWLIGLSALATGALLVVGFLTPIAGSSLGAAGAAGVGFSLLPACSPNLFDSKISTVFALTMLVAVIALGPGAFSMDARVFGRREIIIPPSGSST